MVISFLLEICIQTQTQCAISGRGHNYGIVGTKTVHVENRTSLELSYSFVTE